MFDFQTVKLMHRHADGDWATLEEAGHHGAADHDPERTWLRGAKLYRCTTCTEEFLVATPASAPPNEKPGAELP